MGERVFSGEIGEEIASLFLKLRGYEIVGRNLRTRRSEIDIVAARSGCLVFVEVKLRGRNRLSDPLECVDRNKKERLARGALSFLQRFASREYSAVRFDVVSIALSEDTLVARQIENAFSVEGLISW